ncbi:hypothetical protein Pedsa_0931 [Pseudopedobacter saltans DSM 12145]|uniref:Lipoprotein n=1 Tax=Pseudopedobacter saltans (strain ATCC 51119 / DSM 12145 / JCM 21818 / CCUG 39354 / LMG 10337 / NBRC 100064 / NCIMB 13643) TaxID=762903 RepID=F0SAC6_PSESL|nr:copper resistance protein NlpE N-terminal domain-containing protein [Pseudopedobacter saltans]ADY51503.1 hypothetical protein Pedsa_0931 [Pseudopedobacter saltans DSM 12145]
MKRAIILIFSFSFASCAHQTAKNELLSGEYLGISADQKYTRLSLSESNFEKDQIEIGKEPNFLKIKGTWQAVNDSVIALNEQDRAKSFYKLKDNQLVSLNSQLKENEPSLSIRLFKVDHSIEAEGNIESLAKEGILFFANGNEPFWALKISSNNIAEFNKPDLDTPIKFSNIRMIKGKDYSIVYLSEDSQDKLIIYKSTCVNDMSGKVSPYFVELYFKGTHYRGCGDSLKKEFL